MRAFVKVSPLILSLIVFGAAPAAKAQISVGALGTPVDGFAANPPGTSWATKSFGGSAASYGQAGTVGGLDAGVNNTTNGASTIFAQATSDTGTPPLATLAVARYSTVGQFLHTRPTGNAATFLMASLRNDSGGIISSFDVTYNLTDAGGNSTTGGPNGGAGAIGTPEITQGHRVYYNLGGAAGNWVSLGDRGANYLTNQSITITVSNLSWLGGTTNYLLFVDVNNQTNNDAINQIDNFAITNVVGGVITCPGITNQPQNVSIQQCPGGTATSSISATGTIQSVQWYKSNSVAGFQAISGANSVAYTTPAVTASDDGSLFRAVVSNPNCSATSAVAKLTFVADTTPPRIVTAVAETLTTFAVIFSERIATNTDPIDVAGNFTLTDTNTGNPVTINTAQYFTNSMGILLTTDPRDPTHGYSVNIADLSISDSCAGNAMGETNVPLSTYGAAAIVLDGTHIWKYNTNGTDLEIG